MACHYQTSVLLEVLQSTYSTLQLWKFMANAIIRLQNDLKCCNLDIQNVSYYVDGKRYRQTSVCLEMLQS